jgi:opacity protein-like surface antigen
MLKFIFSAATALLLSMSASAADLQPIPLHFSAEGVTAQRDQYYRFDFGQTQVHFPVYRDFTLNSDGPGDLFVDRIAITAGDYSAVHACPRVLPPRTFCNIRVRFQPWNYGYSTGRMYIDTSAGRITMDFSGWGR